MRIYLLRHGIAEDAGPRTPDSQRQLTDKGRHRLAAVLKIARRAEVQPGLVLSSPLIRAVQTAEMAREILETEAPVQLTPALVPEASPQEVWQELRGLRTFDEILLAGHEPLLSQLTSWLLGAPALQVHMGKAALVSIEMDNFRGDPRGILNWMLTPRLADA
jgi:phosphohistidine phosphatase